jgi:UPF0716 family protein affecting phage T7 exclusion
MSISGRYTGARNAWWVITIGIVLLFFPPLFWLGILLILLGLGIGVGGWAGRETEERRGIRASGEQAREYLGEMTGGWIIVLGVLLLLFPEPITSVIGVFVILLGVGVWIAAWWRER